MANITAEMVKNLREKTGAGMMDCKAALTGTKGDFDAAIDWLRKKGLSKAAKKAERITAEGLIGVKTQGKRGAVVEVNSETDFVARNEIFQDFVRTANGNVFVVGTSVEKLLAAPHAKGATTTGEVLTNLVAKIGENMQVRRAAELSVSSGVIASYVHNAVAPDLGKIGVLVALESTAPADMLLPLGKQLAMHVAAASPFAVAADALDPKMVAHERAIFAEQARASGKPENVIKKMVEGRLRKFYEELVLLSQIFVIDGETPIAKVLEKASKDLAAPVRIAGFVRFAVGEGIEKEETDFAAEVKAAAGH